MPAFERKFAVEPPYSFIGRDEPTASDLRPSAQAREKDGDFASAAVLWRRVLARDPSDAAAEAALKRIEISLGDRKR
jgi:hypothetical protein